MQSLEPCTWTVGFVILLDVFTTIRFVILLDVFTSRSVNSVVTE
jgi:hypothetical protein